LTSNEVAAVLRANDGNSVHVTYDDGTVEVVDVAGVDNEGFLHSWPEGIEPRGWWTRFESVKLVEVLDS
jgi:hypothetical protein